MTEKDFLKVFNDIDDKYVEEDNGENIPVKPVIVTEEVVKRKRSTWNKLIPAAACITAAGGLIAASIFFSGRDSGNHIVIEGFANGGYTGGDISLSDFAIGGPSYVYDPGGPSYVCDPGGPSYVCDPGGPSYVCDPGGPSYVCDPGGPSYVYDPGGPSLVEGTDPYVSPPFTGNELTPSVTLGKWDYEMGGTVYTVEPSDEVTLLDGTRTSWLNQHIIGVENHKNIYYRYFLNGCYAVPFFTPTENRTAGETGDWRFLFARDIINDDITVRSSGTWFNVPFNNDSYTPLGYEAHAYLDGKLGCTAEATFCENNYGNFRGIMLTLDKESCEKLFSLHANIRVFDEKYSDSFKYDFEEERIYFVLYEDTYGFENLYKELYKAVNDDITEEKGVNVRLNIENFKISYTFQTGLDFDGKMMISDAALLNYEILK